jgi:hypothetical protein
MAMSDQSASQPATGGAALLRGLVRGLALLPVVWGCAALWFDGPSSRPLALLLSAGLAGCSVWLLCFLAPLRRGVAATLLLSGALVVWWLGIAPSNDRAWQPDGAMLAPAEITGDRLTVRHVRNFEYRSETEFTPRWETRTFDLTKVSGLDLFLSYWGPRAIAHTILSWQFEDGGHLAISIETRKELSEQEYSAIRGFFRQYELYYLVADEQDLIRLRTNFRGEDTYLYRLRMPPARARALLLDYLVKINRLAQEPEWYNAFTTNCTTAILFHVRELGIPFSPDWKVLLNGYLDESLYEQGGINQSLPFDRLRERSAMPSPAGFATVIRARIPERPSLPAF